MDKITFRMSEAGKCPRALSAQLLNVEAEAKPEWLSRAAEEGNWHEDRIVKVLEDLGGLAIVKRQKECIITFPSFDLVGHIDGIVKYPDKDESDQLLEIKTMSQFEFDRWMKGGFKAFPNYAAQITCYMEATELSECLYIVKNRSSGYEDKKILTEQPSSFEAVIAKLSNIAQCAPAEDAPAPADFDPQSIECRRCEYKNLCVPEAKELTPVEKADLESSVEEWRKGKRLIEQGTELVNTARESFEQHTRATDTPKWSFNRLAIQLVHYNESKTYPKAKLLEVFTEEQLEPALQIKEAYDQLRITDLKES